MLRLRSTFVIIFASLIWEASCVSVALSENVTVPEDASPAAPAGEGAAASNPFEKIAGPAPAAATEPAGQPGVIQPVGAQPLPSLGDAAPAGGSVPVVTIENVEILRKNAEEAALDTESKARFDQILDDALKDLKQAEIYDQQCRTFVERRSTVSSRLENRQKEIAKLKEATEPKSSEWNILPLDELELRLAEEKRLLDVANAAFAAETADVEKRAAQRKTLRPLVTDVKVREEALREQATAPPAEGENPLLAQARALAAAAHVLFLEKQAAAAKSELALYDAEDTSDLPRLRREHLTLNKDYQAKRVAAMEQTLAAKRQMEATVRSKEAQQESESADKRVKPLAERNAELAQQLVAIQGSLTKVQAELKGREEELEQTKTKASQLIQKVDKIGLTDSLGLRLRKARNDLPDPYEYEEHMQNRLAEMQQAQLVLSDLQDEEEAIANPAEAVEQLLVDLPASTSTTVREKLETKAHDLLKKRYDDLGAITRRLNEYVDVLGRLDEVETDLIAEIRQFQAYVDERVLWTRSHQVLAPLDLVKEWRVLRSLASRRVVQAGLQRAWSDINGHPFIFAGVIAMFVLILYSQHRLKKILLRLGEIAQSKSSFSMLPTWRSVLLTAVISCVWPGLLLFVAWRLDHTASSLAMQSFAQGVAGVAGLYFCLEFLRQLCRRGGLAEAHLNWPERVTNRLRQQIRVLIMCGMPLALLTVMLHAASMEFALPDATAERCAFLAALGVLMLALHHLLHPESPIVREWTTRHPDGWLDRLKTTWHLAALAVPTLLAGFTIVGYHFTAQRLAEKLQLTGILLLAATLLRSLIIRWLKIRQRRLRIEKARERAMAAAAADPALPGNDRIASVMGTNVAPTPEDVNSELVNLSEQSQRLVTTSCVIAVFIGLYLTWTDVLPALRFLDNVELWHTINSHTELIENSNGLTELRTTDYRRPITLADVGLAIIILAMTVTAARNLPGLLEISLLERLPLDRSVRYAVTTISSYLIVLMGIVLASQAIGITWQKVQWLAAALTFGLGFGLQEIFANLVSGLIIFIEQPVRLGDIVTIDGVTGSITRIRIRATTITDWDRKEYIVPNKEYITGRLLNWTLSDTTNRIVINVGVAYGSDTDLARKTIHAVAEEHPYVLKEPKPMVVLENFGDSSLNFVLRCYLGGFDTRLETIHELNSAIHRRLSEVGLEIPFPQRDLHIRGLPDGLFAGPLPHTVVNGHGAHANGMNGSNGSHPITATQDPFA